MEAQTKIQKWLYVLTPPSCTKHVFGLVYWEETFPITKQELKRNLSNRVTDGSKLMKGALTLPFCIQIKKCLAGVRS